MEESARENLLHRFLNKETSEPENTEILNWVSASEENRDEFREAHEIFQLSKRSQLTSEIDIDTAWNKLSSQIPKVKVKPKVVYLDIFTKVAVAVLIVLAVGFGSIWTNEHFFGQTKSAIIQFEAPKGEKSKIVLADGSLVWLNSQTILKYDALNPRKVSIVGEAYFEVKTDRANPFEVSTVSGMKLKVTGTRFNLRNFAGDACVETTLDEGEVIIEGINSEQLTVLKPGQQARYDIQNNRLNVSEVSTEIYSLWKNNELRFADISFPELVPRIERWYGVSIDLDSGISTKDRFTMTIKTESLRELLNMMKLTSKFNYDINGAQIKIHAK